MRYIILLLLIVSCTQETSKQFEQVQTPREITWQFYGEQKAYIVTIETHEFLVGNYRYYADAFYLTHYPDCSFCKKDSL